MRVVLLHNPVAGSSSPNPDQLIGMLRSQGHSVTYRSTDEGLDTALADPCDLMLVAGGDGTIAKVARGMGKVRVPLALIPIGTSNNIASSLGVIESPEKIIAGLRSPLVRRLDVATARGPWGSRRFVESAGVGVFATMLRDARQGEQSNGIYGDTDADVRRGVEVLRGALLRSGAGRCRVQVDGRDISGNYFLAAALNIKCIGPRVWLAPDADPGDGLLDVITLADSDRARLEGILTAQLEGMDCPLSVPAIRAAHVRIEWDRGAGHLDDEIWPRGRDVEDERDATRQNADFVEIEVRDPPIEILVSAP